MNRKRFFALITGFALVATLAAPLTSFGMTVEEMQQMIAQLNQQIQQLQTQLAALGETPAGPAFTGIPANFTFDRNLRLGSSGDDVKYLQIVLNADPATRLRESGVGAPGQETSYFGPLTEAAVIKFQEKYANEVLTPFGITSGTGFVGTTTRAKLNAMLVEVNEPILPPPPPIEDEDEAEEEEEEEEAEVYGLEVSFSAANPAPGYIVVQKNSSAEAMKLMAAYNFAAEEEYTVNSITLTRKGFVTDGDIDNLYLYVDGEEVSDYALNTATRKFKFADASGLFTVAAGETVEVRVYLDLSNAVSAAQTVGFDIAAAADISTDAPEVSGLPLYGPMMTVADVTLATLTATIDNVTVSPLDVGSKAVKLGGFSLAPTNNDVRVTDINLTIVGTLGTSDLVNFTLRDKSDSILASTPAMTSGKVVSFSGLNINLTASKDYYVYGDIVGGTGRTFKFTIDRDADIVAYDQEYNVRIPVTRGGTQVDQTITVGTFTMARTSDSPVGLVAHGGTGVVLAKYTFTAGGERTRVEDLTITPTITVDNSKKLKNVKVLVDGSQRGTTEELSHGTAKKFDFSSAFILNKGQSVTVTIIADLTDVVADSTIVLTGGDVNWRLMDSATPGNDTLPNSLTVKAVQGYLAAELSGNTPLASVLAMGQSYEVARWSLLAEAEDVRIDKVKLAGTNLLTNGNILDATLQLYRDGSLVESSTRSIAHDTVIWFGNIVAADGYPVTSRLNWIVEQDQSYELAVKLTVQGYAGGYGATSGDTIKLTLDNIEYYTLDTNATDNWTDDIAASNHEIRRAILSVSSTDTTLPAQTAGTNKRVLEFTVNETSGMWRGTVRAVKLTTAGTATISGTGELVIRKDSTSGTVIAGLRNKLPTNTVVAMDGTGVTINGAVTKKVTFGASHGLSVGDVFMTQTSGPADIENVIVVQLGDAAGADPTIKAMVTKLDGTAPTDGTVAAAAIGDAVFLNTTSLYVPFLSDVLGRIPAGGSVKMVVMGDTTGGATTLNRAVRIEGAENIYWFDEAATAAFATPRITQFPVQWTVVFD